MQVYRGMDIGTAKPAAAERRGVPHHLLDVLDPWEDFSVARFQGLVLRAAGEAWARRRLPMLVGGTGLYVKAVVDNYAFPPEATDWGLRAALTEEAEREGGPALHARLGAIDPAAAARIHPHDVRRVVRALEVAARAGRPISEDIALTSAGASPYDVLMVGVDADRDELYGRIDRRVDLMVSAGLVDEVRRLAAGPGFGRTASQALGYKEIKTYVDGRADLDEAVAILKRNTRRFAKRQLTWFRNDPRVVWFNLPPGGSDAPDYPDVVGEIASLVAQKWKWVYN
jgi:tRNA dimethylallyltransferase